MRPCIRDASIILALALGLRNRVRAMERLPAFAAYAVITAARTLTGSSADPAAEVGCRLAEKRIAPERFTGRYAFSERGLLVEPSPQEKQSVPAKVVRRDALEINSTVRYTFSSNNRP